MAAPTTQDNPFTLSSETSDVIFEVEGSTLYFYKSLLSLLSPVFARMFAGHFKESDTKDPISLSEKSCEEFVVFLKQLHPAYCWLPIEENDLEPLLKLADEYDVQHVKDKCEAFIKDRLKFAIDTNTTMRLFWLTETYGITSLQDPLKKLAIDTDMDVLEACEFYKRLDSTTQVEILRARCTLLEGKVDKQEERQAGRFIRRLKTVVHRLPDLALPPLREECPQSRCVFLKCPNEDREGYNRCTWSSCNELGLCSCQQLPISTIQVAYCKECVFRKAVSIVDSLNNIQEKGFVQKFDKKKITFDEL